MAAALDQLQAKLSGAYLVAEWFRGIGSPAPDRARFLDHRRAAPGLLIVCPLAALGPARDDEPVTTALA